MKNINFAKASVVLVMVGLFIMALSTLFLNPLILFLTVVGGSGLIVFAALVWVYLMLSDIKIFFSDVDQGKVGETKV